MKSLFQKIIVEAFLDYKFIQNHPGNVLLTIAKMEFCNRIFIHFL